MVNLEHLYKTRITKTSDTVYTVELVDFNNNLITGQNGSISCIVNGGHLSKRKRYYYNGDGIETTSTEGIASPYFNNAVAYKIDLTISSFVSSGLVTIKANEAIYQFYNNPTSTGHPTFESNFSHYDDTAKVTYYVDGKFVKIEGVAKNTSAFTPNTTATTICTFPTSIAPSQEIIKLHIGSGINKFMTRLKPDGTLSMERYGTSATNTQVGAGAWIDVGQEYLID